jgi:hypothetical protein
MDVVLYLDKNTYTIPQRLTLPLSSGRRKSFAVSVACSLKLVLVSRSSESNSYPLKCHIHLFYPDIE